MRLVQNEMEIRIAQQREQKDCGADGCEYFQVHGARLPNSHI